MTPEHKQSYWQAKINDWQQTDLTQPAYCKQHDLSYSQFCYWRNRINRGEKPTRKLIPINLAPPSTPVSLILPSGIKLEVPCNSLAEVLPIVYRTVQELA
jgi:hypothetical protein